MHEGSEFPSRAPGRGSNSGYPTTAHGWPRSGANDNFAATNAKCDGRDTFSRQRSHYIRQKRHLEQAEVPLHTTEETPLAGIGPTTYDGRGTFSRQRSHYIQ